MLVIGCAISMLEMGARDWLVIPESTIYELPKPTVVSPKLSPLFTLTHPMLPPKNILALCAVALAAVFLSACNKSPEAGGDTQKSAPGQLNIAVIPKGTTHVFWKSIEAGARKAGAELGVNILWKGPLKENDRAQQISIVEQFISDGVNGIVLAPLDDTALRRPVQAAVAKQIPVVIIDSALKGDVGKDFLSFVRDEQQNSVDKWPASTWPNSSAEKARSCCCVIWKAPPAQRSARQDFSRS